jgi:enterochelin esterase family protein
LQQGNDTTFLYVGEADNVSLRTWLDVFPDPPSFDRWAGTNLWFLTVHLPEGSRVEYKIAARRGEKQSITLDPLNPQRAHDPFGSNSVVTGPGYVHPDWSQPDTQVGSGSIEAITVESEVFAGPRRAHLYLPSEVPESPLPLLVVHDGSEYVEYSALATVLDNLIAAGELAPLAALLTDPVERNIEYTGNDGHAHHVVHELIPAAQSRVQVAQRVALGASLGAVASLHVAYRYPGTFAGLILQSGSFVTALGGRFKRGKVLAPVVEFMTHFLEEPGTLPSRIHLSCGRYDGLYADNRRLSAFLQEQGVDVEYDEVPDGHNWENWRDRLRAGLLHMFDS